MPSVAWIPAQLAILQPTPFCNLDCEYCYLPDRTNSRRMSFDTVAQIAKRLFASPFVAKELTIVWHAGEPLVLPISYYKEALGIIAEANVNHVKLTYAFQTNGTLVTTEWCEFFRSIEVKIGVSIDGPPWLHDTHRVDRSGRGSFHRTLRGLQLLQQAGLTPSIICVITRSGLGHAAAIWDFFCQLGVSNVGFNAEEIEGPHRSSSLNFPASEREYEKFVSNVLVRNRLRKSLSPRIREYETFKNLIVTPSLRRFPQENTPGAILSFDWEGNVSTFSPELLTSHDSRHGTFVFGNVYEGPLEDLLTSPKFKQVNDEILRGIASCRNSCEFFSVCGGGSPVNKLSENGTFDSTETLACRLRVKAVVRAVLSELEAELEVPPSHVEAHLA